MQVKTYILNDEPYGLLPAAVPKTLAALAAMCLACHSILLQ